MTERWRPQSLDDLQSFLNNGHGENHYREFKEQLPPRNERIARQLAGFAIDGGDIFFGVAERDNGFQIAPLELDGLPEKIEHIAQARVDQPLLVVTRPLKDESDSTRGVLWVSVPPSPQAPHQVDGTYYERGDKETRRMSDPEVERLIRSRRTTLEGIESVLREAMAKDTAGELPHIIGVAQPIGAAPNQLYEAVGGREGWNAFGNEVANALELFTMSGTLGPGRYTLSNVQYTDRPRASEGWYRELSLAYDGGIRWLSEDGSFVDSQFNPDRARRLSPEGVVEVCLTLVRGVLAVANKTGHRPSWDLGIGVTRTAGLRGSVYGASRFSEFDGTPPFPDEDYAEVLRVNHVQIESRQWEIVRSLTHSFVEGCGLSFEAVAKSLGYSADEA